MFSALLISAFLNLILLLDPSFLHSLTLKIRTFVNQTEQ